MNRAAEVIDQLERSTSCLECDSGVYRRRLCWRHYTRRLRYRIPLPQRYEALSPLEARLLRAHILAGIEVRFLADEEFSTGRFSSRDSARAAVYTTVARGFRKIQRYVDGAEIRVVA